MLSRRRALTAMMGAGFGVAFAHRRAAAEARAPLQPSPPFELTAHDGRRLRTDRDFAGRPLIVYFGYTFCPDICPSTLGKLAAAMALLEREGQDLSDLGFLFVSVDPARDDLETLAEYAPLFNEKLIGMTGSEQEIAEIAAGWKVEFGVSPGSDPENYLVDHPSYAYGLDREHRVVRYLWHVASPEKLAQQISQLIVG